MANYLGRKSTDLGHALTVLEDVGLLVREPDAFHQRRAAYRIAEPIVTFYHAVMRPEWSDLERPGRASQVWDRVQPTFRSQVLGPHFERVCRYWARWYASAESLGGQGTGISSGTVADPAAKISREIDVVVTGRTAEGSEVVLAIGEAKWSELIGLPHLERLQRVGALVAAQSPVAPTGLRLLLFGGAGFSDEIRRIAERNPGVQLVDLDRLYSGS